MTLNCCLPYLSPYHPISPSSSLAFQSPVLPSPLHPTHRGVTPHKVTSFLLSMLCCREQRPHTAFYTASRSVCELVYQGTDVCVCVCVSVCGYVCVGVWVCVCVWGGGGACGVCDLPLSLLSLSYDSPIPLPPPPPPPHAHIHTHTHTHIHIHIHIQLHQLFNTAHEIRMMVKRSGSSCLCTVCSRVSDSLMLSTFYLALCLPCILFVSAYAKFTHDFLTLFTGLVQLVFSFPS